MDKRTKGRTYPISATIEGPKIKYEIKYVIKSY